MGILGFWRGGPQGFSARTLLVRIGGGGAEHVARVPVQPDRAPLRIRQPPGLLALR